MSVRELKDMPVRVIEQLVRINPIHANRYVRELLIRAELEEKNMAKAEISSHYQDSRMTLDDIHRTIGVCFCAWMASKPVQERLALKASAMTKQERTCLIEAILEEPKEEPE